MLDTLLLLFSTGGTGDHAPDRRFEFACQPHEDVRQLLVRNDVLQVHRAAGLKPSSRSTCRTHLRSVSAVQPILPAIELIAPHCEPYSPACSSTIRTARARTSGE